MTKFERKISRVSEKNWQELRFAWLNHIPEINLPGSKPEESLASNEILRQEAGKVGQQGEYRFEPEVNPAAHLFHESLFTLHTAIRVTCAATQQAIQGLPTWSISIAYQGSILALRALLGFCGIAYLEISGRFYLMDVYPSAPKGKRKTPRRVFHTSANDIQMIEIPRMNHQRWWMLFQRLLRTSPDLFDCWNYPIDYALAHCDVSLISRHRNGLHYRGSWFYEDLFEEHVIDTFGKFNSEECEEIVNKLQEEKGSDGTMILNQVLLGISIAMLRDLASVSRRVVPDIDLIDNTIQQFNNVIVSTWTDLA